MPIVIQNGAYQFLNVFDLFREFIPLLQTKTQTKQSENMRHFGGYTQSI